MFSYSGLSSLSLNHLAVKKNHLQTFIILISVLLSTKQLFGQSPFWSTFGDPIYSANATCFQYDKNTGYIYAGTASNGVFKSIDNGDTWQGITNGLPSIIDVSDLAINSQGKLFGVMGGVIYTYNGTVWSEHAN